MTRYYLKLHYKSMVLFEGDMDLLNGEKFGELFKSILNKEKDTLVIGLPNESVLKIEITEIQK